MLVNVQSDMAVETLPAIHDPNLYKTKNVEDDSVFEESFRLEVSEDEEEVGRYLQKHSKISFLILKFGSFKYSRWSNENNTK